MNPVNEFQILQYMYKLFTTKIIDSIFMAAYIVKRIYGRIC